MNAGHDCFGSTCRGMHGTTVAGFGPALESSSATKGLAEARKTTHPHAALDYINIYRSKHCVQPAGMLIDSGAVCWPSALGKNEWHTLPHMSSP